jgi:hypothetical protein
MLVIEGKGQGRRAKVMFKIDPKNVKLADGYKIKRI